MAAWGWMPEFETCVASGSNLSYSSLLLDPCLGVLIRPTAELFPCFRVARRQALEAWTAAAKIRDGGTDEKRIR